MTERNIPEVDEFGGVLDRNYEYKCSLCQSKYTLTTNPHGNGYECGNCEPTQDLERMRQFGAFEERKRIIKYLMDLRVIREGMFSPQFLVAYTDSDPIDIPADLGAAEEGENK